MTKIEIPTPTKYIKNFLNATDKQEIIKYINIIDVLIAIKKYCEEKNEWPIQKNLAEMTDLSKATIHNLLTELHKNEIIKRSPHPKGGLYCYINPTFLTNWENMKFLMDFLVKEEQYDKVEDLINYFDYIDILIENSDKLEFFYLIPEELFNLKRTNEIISDKIFSSRRFIEECDRLCKFFSSEEVCQEVIKEEVSIVDKRERIIQESNYFDPIELSFYIKKLSPRKSALFIRKRIYPYLKKSIDFLIKNKSISVIYEKLVLLDGWLSPYKIINYLNGPFWWREEKKRSFLGVFFDYSLLSFFDLFSFVFILNKKDHEMLKERQLLTFDNFEKILKEIKWEVENEHQLRDIISLYNLSDYIAYKLYTYLDEISKEIERGEFLITNVENGISIEDLDTSRRNMRRYIYPDTAVFENDRLVSKFSNKEKSIKEIKEKLKI